MKNNNRILIVTQNFFPENFGINDIASDLVEKGFEVDVLTGLPNYPQGKYYEGYGIFKRGAKHYKGARLYRSFVFPRLRNSTIGICLNYASYPFFATINSIRLIFKKYKKILVYEPSPIFTCIPAQVVSFFKRTEKIIYVLDIWPESVYSVVNIKNKFLKKILKKYSRWTYKQFDKLLVTSRGFINQLVEYDIKKDDIIYLPQWTPKYEKVHIENPLNAEFSDSFNLVFTGNIGIPQNLSIIVDAAQNLSHLNNLKWIIVGDGDYLPTLMKLVEEKKLEDRFMFTGIKPYSDMPLYYEIADGLIATLKGIDLFSKIVPAKIQAYMNTGVPILCSINGEGSNVVKEAQCGLTCNAEDAEGFAQIVLQLYNMKQSERNKMGQNGITYANQNFNRETLLLKLGKILSE